MHIFAAQNTRSLKNIWSFPVQSLVFWIFFGKALAIVCIKFSTTNVNSDDCWCNKLSFNWIA